MVLIGMLDSPYVRRCAVSLKLMDVAFEHRPLSVFRNFDDFRRINPVVKAPTLVCGDGTLLMDSTLILDYVEATLPAERRLLPTKEKLHEPWFERIVGQANTAFAELEMMLASARPWLQGDRPTAADVMTAVAWRFGQYYNAVEIPAAKYPALVAYSRRAEALPEFLSTPLD
jgi:glutathione S-transferase